MSKHHKHKPVKLSSLAELSGLITLDQITEPAQPERIDIDTFNPLIENNIGKPYPPMYEGQENIPKDTFKFGIMDMGANPPTFTEHKANGIREQIQARKDQPYYLVPAPLLPLEEAIKEIRKATGTAQTIPISNFKGTIQAPDI